MAARGVVCGSLLLLALAGTPAWAASSEPTLAGRLWIFTDLVLDHHVNPPTRQEMFLGGLKAVFEAAKVAPPNDLSRRVSTLATEEQLAAFLKETWPKTGSPEALEAALLHGLLRRVPGSPNLVSAKELKVMEQVNANRYVGIGIQIAYDGKENLANLVTPFRGGPAHRAGMKPGDLILEVDGHSARAVGLPKVVDMLRGAAGTEVTVLVRQPKATETRTIKMTRGVVPIETVSGHLRGADGEWNFRIEPSAPIAYASVSSIGGSTLHELRQLERRLQADGIRALVLDLRFANGEHMHQVALVAGAFVDGGLLWKVRDAKQRVKEYSAGQEVLFRDCSLVVLVNEFLGADAERLAAILQDRGRAVIVGKRTRGSGVHTDSIIPLPEGQGALVLQTGLVERVKPAKEPARDSASPWVVEPDHVVAINATQRETLVQWRQLKEKTEVPGDAGAKPPEDPQLSKAIELLRAGLKK